MNQSPFVKSFFARHYHVLVLLLVAIFPFWINATPVYEGIALNLRDFDTPFEIGFDRYIHTFLWHSHWGLGRANSGVFMLLVKSIPFEILGKLGLSLVMIQKLYLSFLLFLLGYAGYYFFVQVFQVEERFKNFCGLVAGLAYMLNIPTYTRFIGVPHVNLAVGMYPFLFVFLKKLLEAKDYHSSFKYSLLLVLASIPATAAGASLFYLYLLFLLLWFFLHLITNAGQVFTWRVLSALVLTGVLVILSNLWWIYPIIDGMLGSGNLISETVNHPHNKTVFQIANNLVSFFDQLRLHWTQNAFSVKSPDGTAYFKPELIHQIYESKASYLVYLGVLVVTTWIAALDRENRKSYAMVGLFGITAFLFSIGTHFPIWGAFHESLFYHMPGFQVLRNFHKFQFIMLFWLVGNFGLTARFVLRKLEPHFRRQAWMLVLVFCLFFPFFVFSDLPMFTKNIAGRHEYIQVPPYYYQARRWFQDHGQGLYRTLLLPQGSWEEVYDWGSKFDLVPVHRNFFKHQSLLLQEPDETRILMEPIEALKIPDLAAYLRALNVHYVMVRRDIYPPTLTAANLELLKKLPGYFAEKGFQLEASFGKLDIYRVPVPDHLPILYPVAQEPSRWYSPKDSMAEELEGQSLEKVPFALMDDGKPKITGVGPLLPGLTFKKLNPTHFELSFTGAQNPFYLVFGESFQGKWRLYPSEGQGMPDPPQEQGQLAYPGFQVVELPSLRDFRMMDMKLGWKKPLPGVRHYHANAFANAWYIDPAQAGGPNFKLSLFYLPQAYFNGTLLVFLGSLLLVVGGLAYLFWLDLQRPAKGNQTSPN